MMEIRRSLSYAFIFITSLAGAANVPPEIVQQGVAPVLRRGGTAQTMNISPLFRDPDGVANLVRLSVRLGTTVKTVDIQLFDTAKPITVANFIKYIDSGLSENNFIHRSAPGFVVQGGGFRWSGTDVAAVPTFPAIQNEPGISNLRGTLAMAKLGGDPNSATSQWFVNLADNSANLDAQNGGFTVFAQVVGNGMTVIDEIAALPRVNAGGAFTELPVKDFSGQTINRINTVETSLARELLYSVTSDDPLLAGVALLGKTLSIIPAAGRSGTTTVHLTATDFAGAAVTMDIPVTVEPRSQGWHFETGADGALTLVFKPADPSILPGDSVPVDFGSVVLTETKSRSISIRNDTAASLTAISVTSSGTNAADFAVTGGAGPANIPAGGTVSFTVGFSPGATGSRTAILKVSGADSNQPSLDLAVSGTGAEIPAPVITGVSAQAFDAGADDTIVMPDLRNTVVMATDSRGVTLFAQTPSPGTVLGAGDYTLSFSATNSAGKTATAQTTLAVRVTPPPMIMGVSARTLFAGTDGSAVVPDLRNTAVTATDSHGVTSFTQTPAPGTVLGVGDYTLSFSATNAVGKTATAQTSLVVSLDHVTEPRVTVASAYSGAPLPGGTAGLPAGSVFAAFGTPAISDSRAMASRVTIASGRTKIAAIYVEDIAGLGQIVALQGGGAGVGGGLFKRFLDPLLSPNGKVAFGAKLSGVNAREDDGVWTDLFGSLAPLLREGAPVQGLGALKLKSILSTSITDDALLALVKLVPVPGLVTVANDTALIRITGPNAGTVLARTGSGFLGSTVKKLTVFQPAAASAGQGRWNGTSDTIAMLTLADKRTVLVKIDSSGAPTPLLQTNAQGAGFSSPLSKLGVPSLGGPGVGLVAQRAPQAGVTAVNNAVLLNAPDGVTFSGIVNEQAGFGNFASFSDPVTNNSGAILFLGARRGAVAGTAATSALWLGGGVDAPEIVAVIGGSATDGAGAALADTAWGKFMTFALPDNAGPVFVAQVKGRAVSAGNKLGLWAVDASGLARQLLRTGESITLPAGTKQLKGFTLLNALPGSFGARRSYNSTHSLAVQATFSDHTQALLRVDAP